MTAAMARLPRRTAGPCNCGTILGKVTDPCGRTDTRLYPAGPRCTDHRPRETQVAA